VRHRIKRFLAPPGTRAEQLQPLGLPRTFAEMFAERVDWHELAELVARGCPPALALEVAC
jgi:hypothetical protein